MSRRLLPNDRREQILNAGVIVAEKNGLENFTRIQVSEFVGCAESLISNYFGTMKKFRRDIMRHAIKTERLTLIAQGLAAGNAYAKKAPEELKTKALMSLS